MMSGPIQMLIGPAKGRLHRYMEEASAILSSPVEEKTIEELEFQVEEIIKRVNTSVSLIERCNRDWANLLRDVKGEEKVKEEKEFERVADGKDGYIEALLDAGDVVARLEARLRQIMRKREQLQAKLQEPTTQLLHNESSSLPKTLEATSLRVNLPKIQLPLFNGNIQEFWDMFQSSIDEQNLPAVSKFSYLKGLLKGPALSAIQGIPVTSENYEVFTKLLKDRFKRREAIIESLYSELQNLPKSGGKFSEIQYVSETIEKLLRRLEAQGELINNQRTLIQQIMSKYPVEVIVRLEESKDPAVPWDMESLRKAISHYITVQENVQRYCGDTNVKGQHLQRFVSQTRKGIL